MERIGIALATYNGAMYINEMLNSIFEQDYQNFIVHICDDGSTDDTVQIIKQHELYKTYNKIVIHEIEGGLGACKNFQRVISYCEENYIALCDQDDFWVKNKLSTLLAEIKRTESNNGEIRPCLVFSDLEIVDAQLNIIYGSFYKNSLKSPFSNKLQDFMLTNHIPGCAMMFNGKLKELFLPMPPEIRMHDWWISLITATFGIISYIDIPLIKYRQHSQNTIGVPGIDEKNRMFKEIRTSIYFFGLAKRGRVFRHHLLKFASNRKELNDSDDLMRLRKMGVLNRLYFFSTSKTGDYFIVSLLAWLCL